MPKIAKELTELAVRKLKEDGRYAVGGASGLHLRIIGDSKSWVLRIKVGNIRRDIGLGAYPLVGLKEARELAREYRKNVESGIDPQAQKIEQRQKLLASQAADKTFEECAVAYINAKSDEWKNPKHRQQWINTLQTYAFPHIGAMAVRQINLPEVLSCLEPIWKTKNETASRLRGRIESVLDFASVRQYRTGENPARWKGGLDTILPAPSKIQKVKHHEAMPIDDIASFMRKLKDKTGMSVRALEFLVLTAARSGEIRGAQWQEINLETGVWTVPAERMKAGVEHRVPLSKQALELLKNLPKIDNSPLLFPAPRGGELSDMSLTAVMRRMEISAVPHGFRSSFRDWAGDRTNYPRELAEQALAHTLTNKVEAAYRRSDALERRREMMQEWAEFCLIG